MPHLPARNQLLNVAVFCVGAACMHASHAGDSPPVSTPPCCAAPSRLTMIRGGRKRVREENVSGTFDVRFNAFTSADWG
jgi:hypothetical protein